MQLVDDPAMAAWTPAVVSIVTHLKLGVQALLEAGCTPRGAARREPRTPHPRTASLTDGSLSAAANRGTAARGQRHRRGGTEQPQPDARLSADHRSDSLLHLRERRARPWIAGSRRHRARRPDRRVIAYLGDGSSMYSIQGFGRRRNSGWRSTSSSSKTAATKRCYEFGRHFELEQLPGRSCPQLDFCGLAAAQGVRAIRVEKPADLDAP